jgi:hypothetical protein
MTETIEYKGHIIRMSQDWDTENPRKNFDHTATFAFFHKRYSLEDKVEIKSEDYRGWKEMKADIRRRYKPRYITPVYMYDHSGLVLSTSPFSCPWDSGQVGFMWITDPDIRQDDLSRVVEDEIKELNQWLSGDVWMIDIDDGKECLGGLYGHDYALEEAKSMIDNMENLNDH